MEAKPILVVKLPSDTSAHDQEIINKNLKSGTIVKEYHILILRNGNDEDLDIDVQVLNAKNVEEIDLEELKQYIKQTQANEK